MGSKEKSPKKKALLKGLKDLLYIVYLIANLVKIAVEFFGH